MDAFRVRLTALPETPKAAYRVIVRCAQALGVEFADAQRLVQEGLRARGRVDLPRDFAEGDGRSLVGALVESGASAEVEANSALTRIPCEAHPQLSHDGSCESCSAWICTICRGRARAALCPPCASRRRTRSRRRALRVVVLLSALVLVALWGAGTELKRRARTRWERTLRIAVVFLPKPGVPRRVTEDLRRDLPRLEHFFETEMARHGRGMTPFSFLGVGPVAIEGAPPLPGAMEGLVDRARYLWTLRQYFGPIRNAVGDVLDRCDFVVYVVLSQAKGSEPRFVEGAGAERGDFALVHTSIDSGTTEFALIAIAHELLHGLGATDKYDSPGHAIEPDGLAEPDRKPRFPQRFAEIMVGEVPMTRQSGHPAVQLSEVRVGPATAREIGWVSPLAR